MTGQRGGGALSASRRRSRRRARARGARARPGRGLAGVSLTLHAGEILGVGGLAGHGHRELFFTLFGASERPAATIVVAGQRARAADAARRDRTRASASRWSRKTARPKGCCCRCRSRQSDARHPAAHIGARRHAARAASGGWPREMVDALKIRTPGLRNPVGRLSRRQPAESAGRPLAARRLAHPAALRRHARRRRRHQARDLRTDAAPRARGARRCSSTRATPRSLRIFAIACW